MSENKKKSETQPTANNTNVSSAVNANNKAKEQKKTCSPLYPSQPYTSDK